jgi:hypothetical protein
MEPIEPGNAKTGSMWATISLAVAVAGTVGSLYLSIGMGLKACPIASSPPMAPAPTKPYEGPPEICRPPFKPS